MAATVIAVIQAAPIFKLDKVQQEQTGRQSTAWIKRLAEHLDTDVLPKLPGQFGTEYSNGNQQEQLDANHQSIRVNHTMLYDLANHLRVLENNEQLTEPFHYRQLTIHLPLIPPVSCCPSCGSCLYCPRSRHTYKAWVYDPHEAEQVPVYLAECRNKDCLTSVHPDRFTRDVAGGGSNNIYFQNPQVLQIGRGKFATQQLGTSLSCFVITGHLPLSTFADSWNSAHSPKGAQGATLPNSQLQHASLWRLFVLHHSLKYTPRNTEFSVNIIPSEDDENDNNNPDTQRAGDPLVRAALALFPSVPSGKYRTYEYILRNSR
jgi:hypothetical protein